MKEILEKYLVELVEALKAGASLVGEETSILLKEIATYGFWEGLLDTGYWALVVMVFTVLAALFISSLVKNYEQASHGDKGGWGFGIALTSVIFMVAIMGCSNLGILSLRYCLKAKLAPRLFVLDYIHTHFLNGGCSK